MIVDPGSASRVRFLVCSFFVAGLLGLSVATAVVDAQAPRVLPEGELPKDRRLQPPKDLNGYHPFLVPETLDAWKTRSKKLRRRVLVATGLWPMPRATPLNAKIYGKVVRDGFTVEKVHFESYPGHFVTGLLFRPAESAGKCPAVLSPHGHGGRHQDHGKKIEQLIRDGQEKHAASGRFPKLARCAQLARMGCVTFIYDMLGYADSQQLSYQLAHRYAKSRPEMDTPERWGFYSTQAELRLQSIFGVQTYNSVRALDFLESLPDVDPERIGVTGGSGGGTQTIILCAIDHRPIVAFPQGMVSTSMQGGCTCENCSLLRVGSGNVELTALFAPKPQGMTAANDWTKAMMREGYPTLQKLYGLYGVRDRVSCASHLQFPHNYNYVTRGLMYELFNRELKLGLKSPIVENDWKPLDEKERAVWGGDFPKPPGGDDYEASLTKDIDSISTTRLAALSTKGIGEFRRIVGGAFEAILGVGLRTSGEIERVRGTKADRGSYLEFTDRLEVAARGEVVPLVSLHPKSGWKGDVVLWVDGRGKDGLFGDDDKPVAAVAKLLDAGVAVLTADLYLQGEFLRDGRKPTKAPVVANRREFAGYTFCYNDTTFARRVHDISTLLEFIGADSRAKSLGVIGTRGIGAHVALACGVSNAKIDSIFVDTAGFRFESLKSYRDLDFFPGAIKYGGVPAMLALCAPRRLVIAGERGRIAGLVAKTYAAAGAEAAVRSVDADAVAVLDAAASATLTKR